MSPSKTQLMSTPQPPITGRRPPLTRAPGKQGLYDPQFEHDSCGVGFVVNIKGRKSHKIIQQALQILLNLDHRGACGCEANTGDGAGILMQMPHEFFKRATDKSGFKLPNQGQYGVGMLFMPKDPAERETVKTALQLFPVLQPPKCDN